MLVALGQDHRARDPGQAIAVQPGLLDARGPQEAPGRGAARDHALGLAGAEVRRLDDAREVGHADRQLQALGTLRGRVDGPVGGQDEVAGAQPQRGAVEPAGRPPGGQGDDRVGSGHAQGGAGEAGSGQRDAPGDHPALGGPAAVGPERPLAAAVEVQVQPPRLALRRAVRLEIDAERLVGRQAQRSRQGPAPGLLRLGGDLKGLLRAGVETHVQEVAEVGEAGGMDVARLAPAAAQQPQLAVDVVEPRALGEGRQGLQAELHRPDVEGHRQAAGGRPLGGEARAAQHRHLVGRQARDLQPAMHQGAIVPGRGDLVGLEPDAVLVGDGQLAEGEVAPDVAAQALDLQPAHRPQLQTRDPRLDQQPRARSQHPEAQHRRHQPHEQHRHDDERRRPRRGRAGPHPRQAAGALGRGDGAFAQKLCPMLT